MKWRSILPLLAAALCVSIASSPSITGRGRLQVPGDPCTGTVAAWEFPEAIPEYFVWESFFQTVSRPDSTVLKKAGIPDATAAALHRRAASALSRAQAVRSSSPGEKRRGERLAAETIHDERDEIIRSMTESVFDRVNEEAQLLARQRIYEIPAPGRRFESAGGVMKCRVVVKGTEFPHLIPETIYWEAHFRARALAAEDFVDASGQFRLEHIRAIQRGSIPVDTQSLQQLLKVAVETKAAVDSIPRGGAADLQIAEVVRRARASLIRSLPGPVWTLVNRDAARTLGGSNFTFPSSY